MPPRPKYSKDEIVEKALSVVEEKGIEALTAKELGKALSTSTSPIFTVFNSMKEVQEEVKNRAMLLFETYAHKEDKSIPYFKQIGMQMISFAKEKPRLYTLLFMSSNTSNKSFDDIFKQLGIVADESLSFIEEEYELDIETAKKLFQHCWIYTYGIGTMCASSMCDFSYQEISRMLTEDFQATLLFLKNNK